MKLDYFFDRISDLSYCDLFDNCEDAADVLLKLESYLDEKELVNENNGIIGDYASIEGNYFIGKGTKIMASVTIEGPVWIGENVTIMPGALIRPYSIIGNDVVVGHAAEIKHSIIMNKAKVQSFTFVGDSIIGNKTRIGSGTILSNRRFDQGEVMVKIDNKKKGLKSSYFGSVIGDNTRLGANVTTYPGTFIGKNTFVYPHTTIKGFIESEKQVSEERILRVTDNKKYDLQ